MSDLDQFADGLRIAFGVLLIGVGLIWSTLSIGWSAFAYFTSRRRLHLVTDPGLRERVQSPTPEVIRLAQAQGIPTSTFWLLLSAQRAQVGFWLFLRVGESLLAAWAVSLLVDVASPHLVVSVALVMLAFTGMTVLNARDILTLLATRRYLRKFPESVQYAKSLETTAMWKWTTVSPPFEDLAAERYLQVARRFLKWRSTVG